MGAVMENVDSAYFVWIEENKRMLKRYKLTDISHSWPIVNGQKILIND